MSKPRPLNARQERFAQLFSSNGNASQSAEKAGYAHPGSQGATLLKNPRVAARIKEISRPALESTIATREERQQFWTDAMRDTEQDMKYRLKASELLARAAGDFLTDANDVPIGPVTLRFSSGPLADDA